jgi:hypothetical protein
MKRKIERKEGAGGSSDRQNIAARRRKRIKNLIQMNKKIAARMMLK